MNKWTELFLGVLLIIVPIIVAFYSQAWGAWDFWNAAGTFFKGGLFWFIVMIGVLFVLLGISDLKENSTPSHVSRPQSSPQTPQPQMSQMPQAEQKRRGRPKK